MKKKVRRLVFKHFDRIYNKSVSITKSFAPGMVEITILKELINLSKLNNSEIPEDFLKAYNTLLDELLSICLDNATSKGYIPKVLLKKYINVIKTSFNEGMTLDN